MKLKPSVILRVAIGAVLALVVVIGAVKLLGFTMNTASTYQISNAEAEAEHAVITNRIEIPEAVRQNLGITFAKVEYRAVSRTLRVPGTFESLPSARREYRTPLAGRVEILVDQYQAVTTGTLLYLLDSREWRGLQQEIADAEAAVRTTSAALVSAQVARGGSESALEVMRNRLEADERHDESVRQALEVAEQRLQQVERLQKLVGGKQPELALARSEVATARSTVAQAEEERAVMEQQYLQLATEGSGSFGTTVTLQTAMAAKNAEYEAAKLKHKLAEATVRSVLGVSTEEFSRPVDTGDGTVPYWQSVERVEVKASAPGVVQTIDSSSGSYAESSGLILTTIDPDAVRFRGIALQSDLGHLQNGLSATIVPPVGGSLDSLTSISGSLAIGAEANSQQRTLNLIVTPVPGQELPNWAKAGVAAHAEIVIEGSDEPEPAIPLEAIVQDELTKIFFLRDPDDPDKAIRIEADLGVNDGKWVVLKSGVMKGDEVVLHGVYELKLTGSGKATEGGHFHADGTFHPGED